MVFAFCVLGMVIGAVLGCVPVLAGVGTKLVEKGYVFRLIVFGSGGATTGIFAVLLVAGAVQLIQAFFCVPKHRCPKQ